MKQLKTFWMINVLAMLVCATAVSGASPKQVEVTNDSLSVNVSSEYKYRWIHRTKDLGGHKWLHGDERNLPSRIRGECPDVYDKGVV